MDLHKLGAIESPKDVRNYKAVAGAFYIPEDFPKEFTLYKPHTKSQGQVSSCVAHALSSVVEYFNFIQEHNDVSFSTAYIYGNRSTYAGEGMVTSDALHNLTKYGDCPEQLFKGNYEVPQAIDMFKERLTSLFADAQPHRISRYFAITGEDMMKACLMQFGLLVIAVTWREGTECVNGILHLHSETKSCGGHCMYIYGWNEQGWLVGNSWGTRWGNNGSCILPYSETIREVYGVEDAIVTDDTKDKMIAEMKAQIEALEGKNMELQQVIHDNANELLKLSDEVSELSIKLFSLQTQNANLETDNEELQESIKKVQEDLARHVEQIDNLKAKMDEYRIQKEQYEKQIEDYKKTITQLRLELVQIETPFNTPIGKVIAKVLNWILNLFKKKEQ